MSVKRIEAEPSTLVVELDHVALIIIDMQRDFLEPGGFGETLGNNVALLKAAVPPLRSVLASAAKRMLVIHTREGHRPDLSDARRHKVERGEPSLRLARPVRWAGSWSVASPVTTSSPSSIRRLASR